MAHYYIYLIVMLLTRAPPLYPVMLLFIMSLQIHMIYKLSPNHYLEAFEGIIFKQMELSLTLLTLILLFENHYG